MSTIQISFGQRKLFLTSAYAEPYEDKYNTITSLDEFLKSMPNAMHVLGMDCNGHHALWGSEDTNSRGQLVADIASSNGLQIINTGQTPTFTTISHGVQRTSIVDITAASDNIAAKVTNWMVNPDVCQASDHTGITFTINIDVCSGRHSQSTYFFKNKTAKWGIFKECLESEMQKSGISHLDFDSLDADRLDSTIESMTFAIRNACLKSMKVRGKQKVFNPWWTPELEEMKKNLIQLHHRTSTLKQRGLPTEQTAAAHRSAQQIYKKKIQKESGLHFRSFCNKQGKEDIWSLTNRLIKDSPHSTPPATLRTSTSFTESAEESAKSLLDFLVPDDTPDISEEHVRMRSDHSKSDAPAEPLFTTDEVRECLSTMNPNRAPGHDNFTSDICVRFMDCYPDFLTSLMNRCLDIGHFPKKWKHAIIKVLPKPGKDDYQDISSFRPIGLLPVFGKLLEKLFIKRLTYVAQKSSSWSLKQFGFREQTSAADALASIVSKIKSAKSDRKQVVGVSLDIKSAFPTAWWPALMKRLRKSGCPSNIHRIICSYLQDREVSLHYGEACVTKSMTLGCIQGSVCGPTFWNIILDELLEVRLPENCHIQAYADDVFLLVTAKSTSEVLSSINAALDTISDWGRRVKLVFSPAKTQAVCFTPGSKHIDIHMDGHQVPLLPSLKLLGVILDSQLNFIPHAKYIISKASRTFKNLCKFVRPTWGVHPGNVETIYHRVIEPTITYAAGVWGEAAERPSVRRVLRTLHRTFAIRAIRAFHTVSDISAGALAQFMPLHLKVREIYQIEKVKMSGTFEGLPDDIKMERRVKPQELLHPSERVKVQHHFADSQDQADSHASPTNIFTDGSKLESGNVGCAFVIHHPSGRQESRKLRLHEACTVFQAELFALDKAMTWTSKHAKSDVTIYSDSLSSLAALKNRSNPHPLVVSIHQTLHEMSGRLDVCFVWVKAHIGISGNEQADLAAKEAATAHKSKSYTAFPISYAKHQIRKGVRQAWQQEYELADTGSVTRSFFPSLDSICEFRTSVVTSFEMTQILTGHGFCKSYLKRFKIMDSDACPCGLGIQNFPHLITECPKFESQRSNLIGLCGEQDIGLLDLNVMYRQPEIMDKFITFTEYVIGHLKSFNSSA